MSFIHDVERAAETFLMSLGLLFVPVGTPQELESESLESGAEICEITGEGASHPCRVDLAGIGSDAYFSHTLMETHLGAALKILLPRDDHELHEKQELAEAFLKLMEIKGRERGLRNEDIEILRAMVGKRLATAA